MLGTVATIALVIIAVALLPQAVRVMRNLAETGAIVVGCLFPVLIVLGPPAAWIASVVVDDPWWEKWLSRVGLAGVGLWVAGLLALGVIQAAEEEGKPVLDFLGGAVIELLKWGFIIMGGLIGPMLIIAGKVEWPVRAGGAALFASAIALWVKENRREKAARTSESPAGEPAHHAARGSDASALAHPPAARTDGSKDDERTKIVVALIYGAVVLLIVVWFLSTQSPR